MAVRDWVIVFLFRKMFAHAGNRKGKVWLAIVLTALSQFFHALDPLFIGLAINKAQEIGLSKETLPIILMYVSFVAIAGIIAWIFNYYSRVLELRNSFLIDYNYKNHLLGGVLQFPLQWHSDHHSGDTLDKVNRATKALASFSDSTFLVFSMVIGALVSIVGLAVFNIHSVYIVAIFAFAMTMIIIKTDKVLIPMYKRLNKKYNYVAARIFDVISNITTIIILRIRRAIGKHLEKSIIEPLGLYDKSNKISERKWALIGVLNNMMIFAIVAAYILVIVAKEQALMFGTVAALFAYATRISHSMYQFAWQYGMFVRAKTDIQNAEEIEKDFASLQSHKQVSLKKWKQILVRNLHFSYDDIETIDNGNTKNVRKNKKRTAHLDDIDIDIKRKQKIAFIGHSGSGKTTMLKLIRELYNPETIEVTLDGKQLPNGFANISSSIALIPQDPEIFNTTINENITIGIKKPLKEVRKYARLAKFDDVAMRLPKKYDSDIKEKGVNLSGGEKQRLALTRGLIASKDKEILLLDEPTSSVDTQNELDIFKKIFSTYKQKTIIASVHRLHLLPLFDQIYFFEKGKLIAQGNFGQLKRNSKKFQTLLKKYKAAQKQEKKNN